MYATTPEFLEVFGLNDLGELPALKEIGPVQEPEDETRQRRRATSGERLQKILSQAGVSSRRTAEDDDPGGAGDGERADGDGAGDEGEPAPGPDRD